jgi:transcriptional regulator with XRE-family HTH domain
LITGEQIRAARAMLKWTADDLAKKSEIGVATIRRLEAMNGLPSGQARILDAIQKTLEEGGVEFIGTLDHQPGVRLK